MTFAGLLRLSRLTMKRARACAPDLGPLEYLGSNILIDD